MSEWKAEVYPGSSSLSTRSRGRSFPRDVWSLLAFSPPPGWADAEKLHVKQNEGTPRGDCLKLQETLLFATNRLQNVLTVKSNLHPQFDLIFSFEYWNLKLEAQQFHKNRQGEKKNTMTVMNVLNVTTVSICHPSDPPNLIFSVRTFSSSTRTCIRS